MYIQKKNKKFGLAVGIFFCITSMQGYSQISNAKYTADSLNSELLDAASNGYYAKAEESISKGANVNIYSEYGITPLLYAIDRNDFRLAQLLLQHKADPNAKSKTYKEDFPLLIACERGYPRIVDLLLQFRVDINQTNTYGVTPLHYASFYNDSLILLQLIDKGVIVEPKTEDGETPLLYAAYNGSLFAVTQLLELGSKRDVSDIRGYTPLMVASQNGHADVVFALIEGGADLNTLNKHGFSSLFYAIINKQNDVADLLLLNGANKNENYSLSLNPLALAKITHNKPLADSLKKAGAKHNFLPCFKYAGSMGIDIRFNNKDFLTGFVYSPIDSKYNLEYSLFYFLRPIAVPILQNGANNTFYQYWERRHIIGISLAKRFTFWENNKNAFSLFAEGLYEFHFGRYRGTTINNNGGLLLSPRMGIILTRNKFDFRLSGQYINYSVSGLANWYIGCAIRWNYKKKLPTGKTINYIDYNK